MVSGEQIDTRNSYEITNEVGLYNMFGLRVRVRRDATSIAAGGGGDVSGGRGLARARYDCTPLQCYYYIFTADYKMHR